LHLIREVRRQMHTFCRYWRMSSGETEIFQKTFGRK
jgi:hypothetical protein